jgi:hypothetical protein
MQQWMGSDGLESRIPRRSQGSHAATVNLQGYRAAKQRNGHHDSMIPFELNQDAL